MIKIKKEKVNYINNQKFYEEMVKYKALVRKAKEENLPHPPISNYIGNCIYLIATRLATRANFSNYTFKEDMIGDGIENAIRYIDNFDEEKSKNPYGYYGFIIWRAFVRRIFIEKKQQYLKYKLIEKQILNNTLVKMDDDEFFDAMAGFDNDKMNQIIEEFENKMNEKKLIKNNKEEQE